MTNFIHLNHGWNAEPDVPEPLAEQQGNDLLLSFRLNSFVYDTFSEDDIGIVRFRTCTRYRFTSVNDEGWYRGQCRFSGLAPEWGEFYEVIGDFKDQAANTVWTDLVPSTGNQRNYLFYFRDSAFECSALDWSFDQSEHNALSRLPIECPSEPT